MSNKPTHIAYVVTDRGEDKKAVWHRVGSIFPHKNGKGFDLVIPPGIGLSGRVVCIEPQEDAEQGQHVA